jgi:organic hydroperoxide reductase OsmC/OhrA
MAIKREHHYAARLVWTGASEGAVRDYRGYSRAFELSVEGKPTIHGSADPSFLGDALCLNPEDLLLGALSACHMLSFLAECAFAKVSVIAYTDEASGTMIFEGRGGQFSEVLLRPDVLVQGGDAELVAQLHERAHRNCFIARSVNFPVRHLATCRFQD